MSAIRLEDYDRLVSQVAGKGYRRLRAAGVPIEYEDVRQEILVTFVIASQKFDAQVGTAFTTYFMRAAWINFNRFAERVITEAHNAPISLDAKVGDGEMPLHEVITDERESPEQVLSKVEFRRRFYRRLKPMSRRVLELLETPPRSLVEEWRAVRARASYARRVTQGCQTSPATLSVSFIMTALNLTPAERSTVVNDLSCMVEKVNNL